MKKFIFLVLSFIIVQGCKSSSDLFYDTSIIKEGDPEEILKLKTKANIFSSRDLDTIYSNKKKIKVALFVPLSGKNSKIGEALYNSALISIFDNDRNHNIELVPIDSMEDPVKTSQAFKRKIVKKGIKTVIGPVFSNKINLISRNANRYGVNVISLSNNQEYMNLSDDDSAIFLSGFLPEQQVSDSIDYLKSVNLNNFAIVSPANSYGFKISKIIKDLIKSSDSELIQSYNYSGRNYDFKATAKNIVKNYKVPSEMAEGGGRVFEDDFRVLESDKKYVEAIFFAGSPKQLKKLSNDIKSLNNTQRSILIIAINIFDNETLKNQNIANNVILIAPNLVMFEKFQKSYYRYFDKLPPRISSIVYDSVSAIAEIIDRNGNLAPSKSDFVNYPIDNNSSSLGFSGIDGNFRFLNNGLVQRQFSILKNDGSELYTAVGTSQKFLEN